MLGRAPGVLLLVNARHDNGAKSAFIKCEPMNHAKHSSLARVRKRMRRPGIQSLTVTRRVLLFFAFDLVQHAHVIHVDTPLGQQLFDVSVGLCVSAR